ncbi:MAG TPA: hypothetical protein VK420_10385 [Longimicrobium sp.]|nr:hypothetical protein [Longimicrobium sp.]
MQHLTLEELARLVDEAPEPAEAEHLRDCLVCRRERDAMRAQTSALASLADPEPRPGAWRALEVALAAEGLMRPAPARAFRTSHPLLRIAAALLLFATGAAAGLSLLRPGTTPHVAQAPVQPSKGEGRVLGVAQLPPARAESQVVDAPAAAEPALPAAELPVARLVSARVGDAVPATPLRRAPALTPEARAAARELDEAEAAYVAALRKYAEIADPASGADPETRLSALQTLVETTGRALEQAPGDPVLNGYHLAVLDERDALRRQIDRAAQNAWY